MTTVSPGTSELPLDGVRVVDLSSTMPGAQATQFLAEAGADVVLVEPPGGHPLRTAAAWPAVAGGKRSIRLDPVAESDTLRTLVGDADVVVASVQRGPEEPVPLSRAELTALNPRA